MSYIIHNISMLYITLIYHIKQIVIINDTISHKFLRNKDNNLDNNLVNVKTMKEIVSKGRGMKEMLKLSLKFVTFVIIAAFSIAANERKFSHLKIVKNYLESTMEDERFDYLRCHCFLPCDLSIVCPDRILQQLDHAQHDMIGHCYC